MVLPAAGGRAAFCGMKPWLVLGLLGLAAAGLRAEESFSRAITPEDFAAAELNKLSPAALARLDGLVQAYRSGAIAMVRAEAEAKAAAVSARESAVAAREKELAAEPKAESPGFFKKAKVMLTPGTKVEYGEIESRIVGNFTGWEGGTVFTLENGQRWRLSNGGSYYSKAVPGPKVKIYPAALGGFWLQVEDIGPRVRVMPL